MSIRKARRLFTVLIIPSAVLMIWQQMMSRQGSPWGWQGYAALFLCIAAVAVYLLWMRCPRCGKRFARGTADYCTYCGKQLEEKRK